VQELGKLTFRMFVENPAHPSLRQHALEDNKRGSHRNHSFAVSLNMQYRAIYVVVDDVNVWYWVGTHAAFDRFTGKK
jgi:hypothetical protein